MLNVRIQTGRDESPGFGQVEGEVSPELVEREDADRRRKEDDEQSRGRAGCPGEREGARLPG